MSDVINATRPPIEDATVIGGQAKLQERRRPGRLQNPSPELIALMRKPNQEAIRQVALFDAPHFVPPPPTDTVNLGHIVRFSTAFGICAIVWMVALKMMMILWS